MSAPVVYLGVIITRATTPLAMEWSDEGGGFLFGVTGRMTIGFVVALPVEVDLGLGGRYQG